MNRRTFLKLLFGGCLAMPGVPLYSYYIERHWVDVKQVTVRMLPNGHAHEGVRIVQLSDLHLGHYMDAERLSEVVEQVRGLEPDMVCFTGDLVDREGLLDVAAYIEVLSSIEAPLGKYAVLGNHDYRSSLPKVKRVWAESGFELLHNRHVVLERGGDRLYMAGLADALSDWPDLGKALKGIPDAGATVLLAHEPDYADQTAAWPQVKLQLSGHSHGGQIRLPFYGAVVTPPMGEKYIQGLYSGVGGSALQLYVNIGLGTTQLPFRFLCRPEITVVTLASVGS